MKKAEDRRRAENRWAPPAGAQSLGDHPGPDPHGKEDQGMLQNVQSLK